MDVLDVFSKSDPLCVIYMMAVGSKRFVEIQRTEVIKNTLNPDFTTKIRLTYLFEETQKMRFEMYDVDSKSSNLARHDFIGSAECNLSQIVTSPEGLALELVNEREGRSRKNGRVVISAEEADSCKDEIVLDSVKFVGMDGDKLKC